MGGRTRMVTLLGGALLAVVALAFTWPESRRGESVSAGPAAAAAGESRVQLAQRIRRAPTEEEKPAEPPTETPGPARGRSAQGIRPRSQPAEPARRRSEECRLRELPHEDRRADHARGHDREGGLHRLSRRPG